MGGIAVRMHALPRSTFDVDLTVQLSRDSLPELYARATQLGCTVPEAQLRGWIDSVREMPVVKVCWQTGQAPIDVDLFLAETPFQARVLERRVRRRVDGWEAWFASAEDLILLKLLAGRPKAMLDVADILFIQGELDTGYLRSQAASLAVGPLLEKALKDADRAP